MATCLLPLQTEQSNVGQQNTIVRHRVDRRSDVTNPSVAPGLEPPQALPAGRQNAFSQRHVADSLDDNAASVSANMPSPKPGQAILGQPRNPSPLVKTEGSSQTSYEV